MGHGASAKDGGPPAGGPLGGVTELADRLRRAGPVVAAHPEPGTWSAASVTALLYPGAGGGARLVLLERAGWLRLNPGEIALPGGRVDPGETDVDAALRETTEELGIPGRDVELVARFPAVRTMRRMVIWPFVGLLTAPPELRPEPREVSRAFTVSLEDLARPDAHGIAPVPDMPGVRTPWFRVPGGVAWGLTGGILHTLLERAGGRMLPLPATMLQPNEEVS